MGAFHYDNPFMGILVRIANLILISFYWVVCCIPIVTVIPATAAMYHTTAKVVRGNGTGVTKDFFQTLRRECKCGVMLSLICAAAGCMLAYGLFLGKQMWSDSVFGVIYFAFGILLALILTPGVLYIPPALSRFEGGVSVILRVSLYLASQHILRTLYMLVLLALIVFLVDFYPVLLLILPGVYTDLICTGMEKTLERYAEQCGISQSAGDEDEVIPDEICEMTSIELDRCLTQKPEENVT